MINKHTPVNDVRVVRALGGVLRLRADTRCGAMKFILVGWIVDPMRRRICSSLVGLVIIGLNAQSARADAPSLTGRWSASALSSKWVIGQWGNACGPKPSGGSAPAGEVTVTQGGGELTIAGAGGTYRTTGCWETSPGLHVVGHSGGARAWKTTCKTAAGDSRQTTIVTTISATDDTISFYETGQYQLLIKNQNCTASVGRYRSFHLIQRAGETPGPVASSSAGAPANPQEKPSERCATPGAPARVEVRPPNKLMRPGDSFAFKASVLDAKGCTLRSQPVWSFISGGDHAQVSNGNVSIAPDAPEGQVRVNASVGDHSAIATIEVASKERYEALLQGSGSNALGPAPVASTATKSIGTKAALAENKGQSRKLAFVALVGGIAFILGVIGLVIVRHNRKVHRLQVARLQAEAAAEPLDQTIVPAQQNLPQKRKICPICGTQYPPEFQFCGSDGASLVPIN